MGAVLPYGCSATQDLTNAHARDALAQLCLDSRRPGFAPGSQNVKNRGSKNVG